MQQTISLTYMTNYNGWEVSGDGDPLPPKVCAIIEDKLSDMSISYCTEDGRMVYEELPNESDILLELKKMLPQDCIINDEIDYNEFEH